MKKYLPIIILFALVAIAGYFAYSYINKIQTLKDTTARVLSNPALREQAKANAVRNNTTLNTEAEVLAKKLM